jgi:hypothetical protein
MRLAGAKPDHGAEAALPFHENRFLSASSIPTFKNRMPRRSVSLEVPGLAGHARQHENASRGLQPLAGIGSEGTLRRRLQTRE